uniref:Uncharacterized protein LOC111100030 n=1 Tax=Crassostrea virginica TaxID=6565 RepID=A0A8B8A780_CRAVI|nr:uncharacterized protein LOC111100030 [Crassostrea virginica]
MKTTAWIKNVNRDTGTFFACKQKLTGADLDLELTRIDREKTKLHCTKMLKDDLLKRASSNHIYIMKPFCMKQQCFLNIQPFIGTYGVVGHMFQSQCPVQLEHHSPECSKDVARPNYSKHF